jgi:5'-3' exonuclease
MGIPSFYRQLCRRFPRIISSGPRPGADWLCLDFNCAMYYVLRKMPPVSSAATPVAWEADFATAIADYMREIILLARPTVGVYVSCDGVVCAAKRRQQRLRRFKGPWITTAERQISGDAADSSIKWDQNALTPGTAFMAHLGTVLVREGARIAAKEGIQVVVSTTSEPGEGEHKLLSAMRTVSPAPRSCVIYGLDADLILLSMLLGTDTGAEVHLMREAQEFEGRGPEGSAAEWRCLSVGDLVRVLLPPVAATTSGIRDFVAGMSLLGNDFLPRSLTKTVRDHGIPSLIAMLSTHVWSRGLTLVEPSGGLNRRALLAIVEAWAATEEVDMMDSVRAAARAAHQSTGIGATPAETALREWSAQPAQWASLTRMFGPDKRSLHPNWRGIYASWSVGSPANYCAGLAWVWDYYSGRAVDQGWVFDEHLPPSWADIAAHLRSATTSMVVEAPPVEYPTPLPEWIHLLAVLPMDSLHRLLPAKKHTLARTHPWYWPTSWSLFDVGRSQMWECEAVIPLIPERTLRSLIGGGAVAKK